jgi:hypothetical protein
VLTSAELQRRARAAGLPLTTAAVSPGVVATGIWGNLPRVWRILVRPLARLFAKTPRQARAVALPRHPCCVPPVPVIVGSRCGVDMLLLVPKHRSVINGTKSQ